MKRTVATLSILCMAGLHSAHGDKSLEERVTALEKEVAALKAATQPVVETANLENQVEEQRRLAKERMRRDSATYSRDELREIEELYQVANKQWRSEEGKQSLRKLIDKYDKANRTGCALLYLGQMGEGAEKENYLKQAITGFSDCFYGDGVQVGAYARYCLALYYKGTGNETQMNKLFKELRELYPDAIDHKGNPLSRLMD